LFHQKPNLPNTVELLAMIRQCCWTLVLRSEIPARKLFVENTNYGKTDELFSEQSLYIELVLPVLPVGLQKLLQWLPRPITAAANTTMGGSDTC
jgi:hypothetical protein